MRYLIRSCKATDVELAQLADLGVFTSYEDDLNTDCEDAVDRLKELRRAPLNVRPPYRVTPQPVTSFRGVRNSAIAAIAASRASRLSGVIEFRQQLLAGRLLQDKAVTRWVTQQLAKEPRPIDLRFLLFPGRRSSASGSTTERRLVFRGGALDRLRVLGQGLAAAFGWAEEAAVAFVLTGEAPRITDFSAQRVSRQTLPVLSRIVMTVDPALTPRQVAQEYSRLRAQEFAQRHRNLGKRGVHKHVQLARFAYQRPANKTWDEQRQAWNAGRPTWHYAHTSKFKRDCQAALQRLLGLEPEWISS